MNLAKKTILCFALVFIGLHSSWSAAQGYGYGEEKTASTDRFFLGFSIGDGTYINYKCDYDTCDTMIVGPINFELLLGYKVAPHLYLDLGVNWAIDYSYYDEVTFMAGLRPGARLIMPGLFNRHLYFRAAIPIQRTLEVDEEAWIIGVLLGIGVEWVFQNVGFFIEADILPYFVEVYPGYYVIPVEGRAGVSLRF
jgi:hypothetical protein